MADSSGFGTIKVDAAVLKSKAEDAYVKIQNYREAVEQIATTVSASSGYWEGQAGNLYRDIMRLQVKAIENTLTEYANYPKEMQRQKKSNRWICSSNCNEFGREEWIIT